MRRRDCLSRVPSRRRIDRPEQLSVEDFVAITNLLD